MRVFYTLMYETRNSSNNCNVPSAIEVFENYKSLEMDIA